MASGEYLAEGKTDSSLDFGSAESSRSTPSENSTFIVTSITGLSVPSYPNLRLFAALFRRKILYSCGSNTNASVGASVIDVTIPSATICATEDNVGNNLLLNPAQVQVGSARYYLCGIVSVKKRQPRR